jgi:catechol 2,3-dioxygenase-like lactoylglutathione lyase family enzyme
MKTEFDTVDHVAISAVNVAEAVDWYRDNFQCTVVHQDPTWALLQFSNIKLAIVLPSQHPPHLGFFTPRARDFGPLKPHRDGTRSVYIADPAGNSLELLAPE